MPPAVPPAGLVALPSALPPAVPTALPSAGPAAVPPPWASAVIGRILPPPLRAAETFADIAAPLFAAEETALAGAGRQRRAEFATGRACARAALAGLGVPAVPIVPGACGE